MIERIDGPSRILLDRFQRNFPLVPRPFAELGASLGIGEQDAIERYRAMIAAGLVSRIGAVVAPNVLGSSTLAAMAVPDAELERVAALVSAEPGVNHNYERENPINLWFVVTAPGEAELEAALGRIERATGHAVRDLRLEEPFHLDLGFSIGDGAETRVRLQKPRTEAVEEGDRDLLQALEDGLPLVTRPYRAVGEGIGRSETEVIERLQALAAAHVVRRFGVVVRHRVIGMKANAMAVWDVPDEATAELGRRFAAEAGVTLCYRRRRAADWPYNLYCMVHGSERAATLAVVERLDRMAGAVSRGHAVLFSRRCFKQRGARFGAPRSAA